MAGALTPGVSPPRADGAGLATKTSATGKNYVAFDEFVDFHVHKTQSHIKTTDIATTIVAVLVGFLSYLLLFVVFDQWVVTGGFGPLARGLMLAVLTGTLATVIGWRVVWPLCRRVNALYAARLIEQADPSLKNTLVSLVDLRESGQPIADGDGAVRALEKRAAIGLSKVDVDHAVDRGRLLRLSYGLLAVVLMACAYIVLSPKDPFPSVRRALLPTSSVAVATRTKITDVTPGDAEIPARSLLTVEADIRGTVPESVRLVYTTADRAFVDQPVEMRRIEENLPRFRGLVAGANGKGLLQDIEYHVEAGDARTPSYRVKVVQPPSSTVDELKYVHPPYMQLENKVVAGGPIDGWEGSTLTLKATANMPIKSAKILFFDAEDGFARGDKGEEVDLRVGNGTEISGTWTLALRSDGTYPRFYRVMVETADKQRDPDPPQYGVKVRPDQPPEVAMLHPTSDMERPANAVVPFVVQATDPDFGLRTFLLKLEKNGESLVDQRLFEDQIFGQSFRGEHDLDLKSYGLKTGDTLAFWVEVRDTKQPVANRRVTNKLNIKIVEPVSPEQVREQLAADKREQQDQLAQADPEKNGEGRDEPAGVAPNAGKEQDAQPNPREGNPEPKEREPKEPGRAPAPNAAPKPEEREPDVAEPPANGGEKDGARDNKDGDKPPPPADDAEALEKFIRKLREEQAKGRPADPKPGEAPQDQPGQPQDQPQEGEANPNQPGNPQPAEKRPGERAREDRKPGDKLPNGGDPPPNPKDQGMPSDSDPDEGAKGAPKDGAADKRPGDNSPPSKSPNKGGDKPRSPEKTSPENKSPEQEPTEQGTNPPGDPNGDASPQASPPNGKSGDKKPGTSKEQKSKDAAEPGEKPAAPRTPRDKGASPKEGESEKDPNQAPRDGTKPAPSGDKPGAEKPDAEKRPDSKAPMPADSSDKPDPAVESSKPGDKGMPGDPNAPKDKGQSKDPGQPGAKEEPSKRDNPKGSDASRPQPGDMPKPGDMPQPGDASKKPDNKPANGDMPPQDQKPESGDGAGKKPANAPKDEGKPDEKGGEKGPAGDMPKPNGMPDKSGVGGADAPMPSDKNEGDPAGKKGGEKPSTRPGQEGRKPKPADAGPDAKRNPQNPSDPPRPDDDPAGKSKPGDGNPELPDAQPTKAPKPGEKTTDKPQDKGPMNEDAGAATPGADNDGGGPDGQKSRSKKGGESGQKSTDGTATETKPGDGKPGSGKSGKGKTGEGESGAGSSGAGPSKDRQSPDKPGAGDKGGPKQPGDAGDKPGDAVGDKKPGRGEKPGAERPGANEPGDEPGDMPNGSGDKGGSGKPEDGAGDKPGSGDKPGDANSGKPGDGKPGDGKGGGPSGAGQPGSGKSGRGGGPNNSGSGKGAPGELGAPNDGGASDPSTPGQGAGGGVGKDGNDPDEGGRPAPESGLSDDEQADKAKLEYARKASNLVLNRLKDELERGEVDQQTLDELGWTKQELEQFVKRLEKRVATPSDDDSPEAAARRIQFEEELRSLRLGSESKSRTGGREVQRRTNVTNKKLPVPPELRDQYDAYTKGLSKSGKK